MATNGAWWKAAVWGLVVGVMGGCGGEITNREEVTTNEITASPTNIQAIEPTLNQFKTPTTFPLPNTLIAYTSVEDGYAAVYTINPNGTERSRLTEDPRTSYTPKWSPTGEKIAFLSGEDPERSVLYILTLNTGYQDIVDIPGIRYYAWSSDGKRLAFAVLPATEGKSVYSGDELDYSDIYIYCIDDLESVQITKIDSRISDINWLASDNQLIVLEWDDGISIVNVDDIDGGTISVPSLYIPHNIDIEPSGNLFAVDGDTKKFKPNDFSTIRVINISGDIKQIHEIDDQWLWDPQWSPDGKMLAFRGMEPETIKSFLYIIEIEGGEITQIPFRENNNWLPSWGPNGNFLLFLYRNDYEVDYFSLVIYSIPDNSIFVIVDKYVGYGRPVWKP